MLREGMQLPAGQVHVLRRSSNVKAYQLPPKLRRVGGLDTRLRSGLEEVPKPFVPELLDHPAKCIASLHSPQAQR